MAYINPMCELLCIGMHELDSDGKLLTAGGKTAKRDIVQFVAHSNQEFPVLAQKVLAEVGILRQLI